MKKYGLVIPIHLYDFDEQGGASYVEKNHYLEYVLLGYRNIFSDAYIVITGHGVAANFDMTSYCDYLIWGDLQPRNSFGLFVDNPAQFKNVSLGFEHLFSLGISKVGKVRGDALILNPAPIYDFWNTSNKDFLITQQTSYSKLYLGDCFMFSNSIDLINSLWSKNNFVSSADGLINTANNFLNIYKSNRRDFNKILYDKCDFFDIPDAKIICLRYNYDCFLEKVDKNDLDSIYWGARQGFIKYGDSKILSFDRNFFYTKKLFYSKFFRLLTCFFDKFK